MEDLHGKMSSGSGEQDKKEEEEERVLEELTQPKEEAQGKAEAKKRKGDSEEKASGREAQETSKSSELLHTAAKVPRKLVFHEEETIVNIPEQQAAESASSISGPSYVIEASEFRGSTIGGTAVHYHGNVIQHYHYPGTGSAGRVKGQQDPTTSMPKQRDTHPRPPYTELTGQEQIQGDSPAENLRSVKTYEEDGVKTVCKNMRGGMVSISKSMKTVVGSAERRLIIGGCIVTFHERSFVTNTLVFITLEIDSSKWEGKFIGCTPTLRIKAEGLKKKAHVRLPSWCVCNGEAFATLWHRPENGSWEETKFSLPITQSSYFEFDWDKFSDVAFGRDQASQSNEDLLYRIAGGVYTSDQDEVSIAFHLDDRGEASPKAMAGEWVAKHIEEMNPPRSFKIGLKSVEVKRGQSVSVRTKCTKNELKFVPKGPFTTKVDLSFIRSGFEVHNTGVHGDYRKNKQFFVECRLFCSGEFIKADSFAHVRDSGNEFPTKKKQVQGLKNINKIKFAGRDNSVDQRRTARNILEGRSRMRNREIRTRTRIRADTCGKDDTEDSTMDDSSTTEDASTAEDTVTEDSDED